MTQVLHVLSAEADFQSRRGADALRRDPNGGFCAETKTIGRGGTWRSLPFSIAALRSAQCDVVHAWDFPSLWTAVLAKRAKIVFTPPTLPTPRQADWLRVFFFTKRSISLVCDTKLAVQTWLAAGAPAGGCHLIRPGVETNGVPRMRDGALRATLGFSEADHVVLAVGESTDAARHDLSVWGVSIAHVLDRNQKILLWGRGRRWRGALKLAIRLGDSPLYSVAAMKLGRTVEFDELCSAADIALVTAEGAVASLPIAICMARGLPIMATPSPVISEVLEDGVSAKIVPPSARQIARGIEELRGSLEARQNLTANAMAKARGDFAMRQYVAGHRQLYANL